jgi:hypothetical protein
MAHQYVTNLAVDKGQQQYIWLPTLIMRFGKGFQSFDISGSYRVRNAISDVTQWVYVCKG